MSSHSKRRTIPDWQAIQQGENAVQSLAGIWRGYAANAAQPYGFSAFRKEFRKWQEAAPPDPSAEYAASDVYWQGKAGVRPRVIAFQNRARSLTR